MLTMIIGISFLYAIWHSPAVRSQLTLDDVDFTILAATSVLTDLIDKCPPAEACRDAFTRMSKATISMCMSTTGFGNLSSLGAQPLNSPGGYFDERNNGLHQGYSSGERLSRTAIGHASRKPVPRFDMNLKDLFSEEELDRRPQSRYQRPYPIANLPMAPPQPSRASETPVLTSAQSYTATLSPRSTTHSDGHPYTQPPTPDLTSQQVQQQTQQNMSAYGLPSQQPQGTFPDGTISQQQSAVRQEFMFDNLDFLDTFQVNDPSQSGNWVGGNELDLGFGTGGTGGVFDSGDGWDNGGGGGVDLFDGFFFGNGY